MASQPTTNVPSEIWVYEALLMFKGLPWVITCYQARISVWGTSGRDNLTGHEISFWIACILDTIWTPLQHTLKIWLAGISKNTAINLEGLRTTSQKICWFWRRAPNMIFQFSTGQHRGTSGEAPPRSSHLGGDLIHGESLGFLNECGLWKC